MVIVMNLYRQSCKRSVCKKWRIFVKMFMDNLVNYILTVNRNICNSV